MSASNANQTGCAIAIAFSFSFLFFLYTFFSNPVKQALLEGHLKQKYIHVKVYVHVITSF